MTNSRQTHSHGCLSRRNLLLIRLTWTFSFTPSWRCAETGRMTFHPKFNWKKEIKVHKKEKKLRNRLIRPPLFLSFVFPFPRVTYYGCSATHITYTYIGFRFLAALGAARNSSVRFFVLGRAAFLSFSVRLPSKSVCPFFLLSFDWHIDFAGG